MAYRHDSVLTMSYILLTRGSVLRINQRINRKLGFPKKVAFCSPLSLISVRRSCRYHNIGCMTHASHERSNNFRHQEGTKTLSNIRSSLGYLRSSISWRFHVVEAHGDTRATNRVIHPSYNPYQLEYATSIPTLPFHRLSVPPPAMFGPLMPDAWNR